MTYSTTNPSFDALLKRLGTLHDAKNRGYATGRDPLQNFRIANRFGVSTSISIAIRLSDKINRWLNVMEAEANNQVGESAEETMTDLVVYGMLWLVAREEEALCQHNGDTDNSDCPNAFDLKPGNRWVNREPYSTGRAITDESA